MSSERKSSVESAERSNGLARRSFLKGAGAVGVMVPASFAVEARSYAESGSSVLGRGDAAILQFLAAIETIETDLWQQYNELGGIVDSEVPGGSPIPAYVQALQVLDGDMPQYIHDNTEDEISHMKFLNAYLAAKGAAPVNLDAFRTIPGSKATGAQQIGRLTNLMELTVDTSWYTRYRSTGNPDFGDSFPQIVNLIDLPGIPATDVPVNSDAIQLIANTAGFHFATIEQGGSSLYDALSLKCSSLLALRIVTSIEGSEVAHFEIWNDKAGDAPPVDSGDGLVFPDLNLNPATQTNQVMPKPCKFISPDLPLCSIIRPTSIELNGATAVVNFLNDTGLFHGQSQGFFDTLFALAKAADEAKRECGHG